MTRPAAVRGTEITATLDREAAARIAWDVVVVGAGPAGAAAASRLAAGGVRVLLVDRAAMPRAKVCGSCLSPAAVDELARLAACVGGDAALPAATARLEAVRLAARGACVRLPMPPGAVVSRETLDPWLVRGAIAAGSHWLPRTGVAAIDDSGDGDVTLTTTTTPSRLRAAFCVLATGLAGHVRLAGSAPPPPADPSARIGLGAVLAPGAADLPCGDLLMVIGRAGYCGLVRLEDGRIDVAAAVDPRAVAAAGAGGAVRAILADAGGPAGAVVDATAVASAAFRATPRLTRSLPPVAGAGGRILRVGDAAGYVEPFTGEGIGWALASGRLVASALMNGPDGDLGLLGSAADVARAHAAAHRAHFAPRHARCRRVARGLRMPAVVAATMQAARVAPWIAGRLVPVMVGATGGEARGR